MTLSERWSHFEDGEEMADLEALHHLADAGVMSIPEDGFLEPVGGDEYERLLRQMFEEQAK